MFTERARGRSVASIARELNDQGVPCPSGVDQARNRHRSGERWITRTVLMILENPRYTGRQVWNRQATKGHGDGGRVGGRGSGAVTWNPVGEWEVSDHLTHIPLVDETAFIDVQRIRADRPNNDDERREYALAGLITCGVCERRMDSHWVHGRPGYRCRHGYTTATPRPPNAPPNVYVREDHLVDALAATLHHGTAVDPDEPGGRLSTTVADDLRRRGLQVVCGHQRHSLRPASRGEIPDYLNMHGQSTLDLEWVQPAAPMAQLEQHKNDDPRESVAVRGETQVASEPDGHGPT
ncbi:recombinase family protein [Actinokineospora sp. HUAS TT18]|uniref:recombinase family protein n=1 Tax=Actinokineospora sp. HUAS TT18 TaxID=3447451 RepID=UPI003F51F623